MFNWIFTFFKLVFFAPFGLISYWSTAYPLLPHSWFFQLQFSRPSSPLIPSIICQKRLFGRDTSLLLLYYDIKLSSRSVRSRDRRMIKKGMSPTHGLLWGKKIDSNIYIYRLSLDFLAGPAVWRSFTHCKQYSNWVKHKSDSTGCNW